ncbi:MAG TPA: 4-hydroxythreonine-4-phosphate dehydrogenase PdxA [Hyphomicrobiaceae bacterium]|nr:4-hydroxythreonine-4-phosphate dehydrogenase PdxA [Hyphomicrobiaceae bacterium]
MAASRPLLALAMGDPAGISPELTAKLLADEAVAAAADLVVIGDRRVLAAGESVAGVKARTEPWIPRKAVGGGHTFVDLAHLDPTRIARGASSKEGGAFALRNFRTALALGRDGVVDAVTFTPFNKHAMKLAAGSYEDEIAVISEVTGTKGHGREFNILGALWNARVTSHVPLKDVAKYITREAVVNGLVLTDRCMKEAGVARPRIAVAGLNPHAGDEGNFGREEIDVIAPAVVEAKAKGIACEGPFPSDTVFLRAKRGDFDAVQTMYHDQGQIAMKLMGFESGITLIGGYAFPVCTPAHGTAYDIAGKGIADLGASRNAILIAAKMVSQRKGAPASSSDRAAALARSLDAAKGQAA